MPLLPRYEKGSLIAPGGDRISYLMLGDGPIPLVLIPGGGDGVATVSDAARRIAFFYRKRASRYRMLLLSRRQPIPSGFTVERHADDYAWAMELLEWEPSVIECNSAGGPIGQWLAVKRPDLVQRLILSCTLHCTDPHTRAVVEHWMRLARRGRWYELRMSSIEYTYCPQTVQKYQRFLPLLRLLRDPRYPERPARIFEGLIDLDNRPILPDIEHPALVIGGEDDRVIPAHIQLEMADLIPNSDLILYPGYGHGNDQENPDYERQVDAFIRSI
ncbi:MAG TPA: alpha/beta hydrolase [Rubrobacter sp.]|nr:alpha/beta hydrolase [Rubrobacter sp.]